MDPRFRKFLELAGLPLVILAVFLALWGSWRLLDLPSETELIQLTRIYFDTYGYWIVFVSAIIEGVLMAGWYYPGSLVIFLGVMFAGKNIPQVIWVIILVSVGMFLAYLLDYALGRYGWYKLLVKFGLEGPIETQKDRLSRYGARAIFLSYWHPNLAALTSTAAGILHFPFLEFILDSALALAAWNVFWGALAYILGEAALKIMGLPFILLVLVAWIAYRLIFHKQNDEQAGT